MTYILFDIGGTKTRIAVCNGDCTSFEEKKVFPTPQTSQEGVTQISEVARELTEGKPITGVSGDIAGILSGKDRTLMRSPNLSGWVGVPIKTLLEEAFQSEVFIENDGSVVGLGEAVAGAGKGFNIVAYITVSTGVGGGRIVNGKIDEYVLGFEPGHQVIDLDQSSCTDCIGSDLESMVSGSAVEKRFGKKPYEIPQGDGLWEELAAWLAYGLNNTIVHWSPDVVVLGGSMIVGDPAIPISAIERNLEKVLKIFPKLPQIKKASLGDIGGLHGAFANLRLKRGA